MLTIHEQKIFYDALLHNDGHSLMPEWELEQRKASTLAMDKIRRGSCPTMELTQRSRQRLCKYDQKISKQISIHLTALKYWLSGDNWTFAMEYSKAIHGFKR